MGKLTTITRKHQVTIPVQIIRDFGLSPKDKVYVEKTENLITIKPLKQRSFLDLYGTIKTKKKPDFKKLRKQFETAMAKKAL